MNEFYILGLLITIFIFWIILRLNRAKIIGKRGERSVSFKLHFLPDEYRIVNDVYIYLNDKSVQIDHIVVSKYGVFVIETKNYKGWIFGHENSEEWKQSLLGKKRFWGWSSEQHKFRNPIRQNEFEDRYNLL